MSTAENSQVVPPSDGQDETSLIVQVALLKIKFNISQSPEDREALIPLLEKQLDSRLDPDVRESALFSLCTALSHRFQALENQSRPSRDDIFDDSSDDLPDISNATVFLSQVVRAGEASLAEAHIYLGIAYWRIFQESGDIHELDRGTNLLFLGLKYGSASHMWETQDSKRLEAHNVGVELFAICSSRLQRLHPYVEVREQIVQRVEEVLNLLPPDAPALDRLRSEHVYLLARRCFQPMTFREELVESVTEQEVRSELDLMEGPAQTHGTESQSSSPNLQSDHAAFFMHEVMVDDRADIRLITLCPGGWQDPLQCQLTEYEIAECPQYDALSYVWGDANDLRPILLNNAPCRVTKSVDAALRRLRRAQTHRLLWIDAICIDQQNNTEKSNQIALMETIYSRAEEVILWLGEPEPAPAILDQEGTKIAVREEKADSNSKTVAVDLSSETQLDQTLEQQIRWRRKVVDEHDWFRPVTLGTKSRMNFSTDAFDASQLSGMFSKFDRVQEFEQLMQNVRMQRRQDSDVMLVDWSDTRSIALTLRANHDRTSWPVLGALILIHNLAEGRHIHELPFFNQGEACAFHTSAVWFQSVRALHHLLSAPYWDRTWVLQEIVLAKKPVIYYGRHLVPFDSFVQAQRQLAQHYFWECCAEIGPNVYQSEYTLWVKLLQGLAKFETLNNFREALALRQTAGRRNTFLTLAFLLISGIGVRKATDPRDLIYGLMGLVESSEKITADYNRTIGQVYARAAFDIMSRRGELFLLGFNQTGRNRDLDIPSWAPDWSTVGNHDYSMMSIGERLRANPDERDRWRLHECRLLEVESIQLTVVGEVASTIPPGWDHVKALVAELHRWLRIAGLEQNPDNDAEGYDRVLQFWTVLFAGRMNSYKNNNESKSTRQFKRSDLETVLSWWAWLQAHSEEPLVAEWYDLTSNPHRREFDPVTEIFHEATRHRKFFVTEERSFGTGPGTLAHTADMADMIAGDEIHVISGYTMPLVLRSVQAVGGYESMKTYEIVGTCFLENTIDGDTGKLRRELSGERQTILLC